MSLQCIRWQWGCCWRLPQYPKKPSKAISLPSRGFSILHSRWCRDEDKDLLVIFACCCCHERDVSTDVPEHDLLKCLQQEEHQDKHSERFGIRIACITQLRNEGNHCLTSMSKECAWEQDFRLHNFGEDSCYPFANRQVLSRRWLVRSNRLDGTSDFPMGNDPASPSAIKPWTYEQTDSKSTTEQVCAKKNTERQLLLPLLGGYSTAWVLLTWYSIGGSARKTHTEVNSPSWHAGVVSRTWGSQGSYFGFILWCGNVDYMTNLPNMCSLTITF